MKLRGNKRTSPGSGAKTGSKTSDNKNKNKNSNKKNSTNKSNKKKRHNSDSEDDGDDHDYDNEYHVRKADDESVDDSGSEVGWNSEDEVLFQSRRTEDSDAYESDDYDSAQEEPHDGEILLSDLIGTAGKIKKVSESSSSSSRKKQKYQEPEDLEEEEEDYDGAESEMVEDEENVENVDSNDDYSDDESEEDEELEDVHSRLLSAIDKFAGSDEKTSNSKEKKDKSQLSSESAYSTVFDGADVSMNALLNALSDTRELSVVKKRLSDLEAGLSAPKYVEKVIAERIERSEVYEDTKTEMGKWQDTVVQNRHLKTLDLAQDKRQRASFKTLVKKFVPTTDMEKEIHMVLVKQGIDSGKEIEKKEVDELRSRNLSFQEIREKQAQLAKVKALMFYEQMKRHRLNKIKSKAYRSIRKRQRTRKEKHSGVADVEIDEEDEEPDEKNAYNRVKERMDLRHKNTSKWAKQALKYAHADDQLRAAYHESVQLGHELTRKANEEIDKATDSNDEHFDPNESITGQTVDKLRNSVLGEDVEEVDHGKYKKLFAMDFMKRAADEQRRKAKEEALSVLKEIQQMEHDSELSSDNEKKAPQKLDTQEDIERKKAAKKEVNALFNSNGGMSLATGSRKKKLSFTASIANEEKSSEHETTVVDSSVFVQNLKAVEHPCEVDNDNKTNPWLLPSASVSKGVVSSSSTNKKSKTTVGIDSHTGVKSRMQEEKTLYLNVVNNIGNIIKAKTDSKTNAIPSKAEKKRKRLDSVDNTTTANEEVIEAETSAPTKKQSKLPPRAPLLQQKSQVDLVKIAFAGPDLEAEFNSMKEKEIEDELGLDEKKKKVLSQVKAGWGDWAGPGNQMVSQKILNKRDEKLSKIKQESEEQKSKRKDKKLMNVLISEKRIKTASKYKIADIPHPFTTREEYERSLQMPLGDEWNAAHVVKANTQPEIKTRAGRIIEPIKLVKGAVRAK